MLTCWLPPRVSGSRTTTTTTGTRTRMSAPISVKSNQHGPCRQCKKSSAKPLGFRLKLLLWRIIKYFSLRNYRYQNQMNINETLFAGNCIRTFTGLYMNVFNPEPEMICIEDIAHALSHVCRFAGHTKLFYSVAQHSVLVAQMVPEELRFAALLHDASEAYLGDLPSPIKKCMPEYKILEKNLSELIHNKFMVNHDFDHPNIKDADIECLKAEHSTLMLGNKCPHFQCWGPEYSKDIFLSFFERYNNIKPTV